MFLLKALRYRYCVTQGIRYAERLTALNIAVQKQPFLAGDRRGALTEYRKGLIRYVGAAIRLHHLRFVTEHPPLYATFLKSMNDPEVPIYLITSFNPNAARNPALKRELITREIDTDFLDGLIPEQNFSHSKTPLGLISVQFKEVVIFEPSIALFIRFAIEVYPDFFELLLQYGGFSCFEEKKASNV